MFVQTLRIDRQFFKVVKEVFCAFFFFRDRIFFFTKTTIFPQPYRYRSEIKRTPAIFLPPIIYFFSFSFPHVFPHSQLLPLPYSYLFHTLSRSHHYFLYVSYLSLFLQILVGTSLSLSYSPTLTHYLFLPPSLSLSLPFDSISLTLSIYLTLCVSLSIPLLNTLSFISFLLSLLSQQFLFVRSYISI